MIDPLKNFNWQNLYTRYDELCKRFDYSVEYLDCFKRRPRTDGELYYCLIEKFSEDRKKLGRISLESYQAMLYWKIYSQPAAKANIFNKINEHPEIESRLKKLSEKLPQSITEDRDKIIELVQLDEFSIFGMGDPKSFPVRTTFLHFLYPEVVPIFDTMVLRAVGITEKDASHNIEILREYISFAWDLAKKYREKGHKEENGFKESWVRLVDMALWAGRGDQNKNNNVKNRKKCCRGRCC